MDSRNELRNTGETPFGNVGGIARGPTSTRAAIYGRISTADGRQDVDNQLDELRRFAATQNWEVVCEYIDYETGGHADRPEFQRMLADAAQRHFDVLLFRALNRLTSEGALQTLHYLNQLSEHGVAFRSFREPYIDSYGSFSEALIAILGAIAKQERVRIEEQVQVGVNPDIAERLYRRGEFQKILDHKGRNWGPYYSLAYLGLARASAHAGDIAKAKHAYQNFLALWKDADKDAPFLKQASEE